VSDAWDALRLLLEAERDAALREAAYERSRAQRADAQNEALRDELLQLRKVLRALVDNGPAEGPTTTGLQERLQLAAETNWRLEQQADRLREQGRQAASQVTQPREENRRLAQRLRAMQGQLRLGRS
jgi:hypothetical protein